MSLDLKGRTYYFLGIGGIGMSALARHVLNRGGEVFGYDLKETELTKNLATEGARIHYSVDIEMARQIGGRRGLTVIYTPALPDSHRELQFFREHGPQPIKRAKFLGEITRSHQIIAVAGTHGKTTITSMLAHIFTHAGEDPNVFLGGISVNLNSNHRLSKKRLSILEADEYDRSFLNIKADISVISNMDPDHLDIYGNAEAFEEAFVQFQSQTKKNENSIYRFGLPLEGGSTYGFEVDADYKGHSLEVGRGRSEFAFDYKGQRIGIFNLPMPGLHNVENAIAAIAVALKYGIEPEKVRGALNSFKGIHRRFELVFQSEDHIVIDDYAHHPKEIRAVLESLRKWYPKRNITAVFQPHLFSRTKDQKDGFIESLDLADQVILLDIYPARELPMPGITSTIILEGLSDKKGVCVSMQELPDLIAKRKPELLVLMGAGDIDSSIRDILKVLK